LGKKYVRLNKEPIAGNDCILKDDAIKLLGLDKSYGDDERARARISELKTDFGLREDKQYDGNQCFSKSEITNLKRNHPEALIPRDKRKKKSNIKKQAKPKSNSATDKETFAVLVETVTHISKTIARNAEAIEKNNDLLVKIKDIIDPPPSAATAAGN